MKLSYRADRSVLLIGRHGLGKSAVLEAAAAELGIGCIVRDLSLMEPPDLSGLPQAEGNVTRYLPPSFLPNEGKGFLVFEELNRCPKYMQAPCLQLLTARRLNDYVLPPGWLPVAAINPAEEGYDVDELDAALRSRFATLHVQANVTAWLSWARDHNIHRAVVAYAKADPTIFDHSESNPRAWADVSKLLWAWEKEPTDLAVLKALILGTVGDERGTAFLRVYQSGESSLSVEDVLKAYPRHRQTMQETISAGRLDLASATLLALEKYLQSEANYQETRRRPKAWSHLADFLADLPADLRGQAVAFFRDYGYDVPEKNSRRKERRA